MISIFIFEELVDNQQPKSIFFSVGGRKSYSFEMTWGRENNDRICYFWANYPFMGHTVLWLAPLPQDNGLTVAESSWHDEKGSQYGDAFCQ